VGKGNFVPDFSYLMILQLKDFYTAKFVAFRRCAQSCQELCDCAYELSKNLNPSLQSIGVQALYITEELIGVDNNICSVYRDMNSIIDLAKFKRRAHQTPVC
jgi:hypothetical protein